MSQIFYSEIDLHLQKELDARARAGTVDRSETALRYMTEKIANVSLTAYEGNKRDKTKIVHELGGRKVLEGEYLPGGDNGFLTERNYTLGDSRWVVNGIDSVETKLDPFNQKTTLAAAELSTTTQTKTNKSYRIPPIITQASLQINDNSKGTTNKATINITIPNPDRDLNFMESVYARPGRYCMVRIEHPNSALMTRDMDGVNGMLLPSSLPARNLIKERYPEAEQEYDEIRKMNKIQFEGLITAFEYTYNQDGTVTMTVYILGTSQTYTDLSLIMQTASTGSVSGSNTETVDKASTFYTEIYKEVESTYKYDQEQASTVRLNKLSGLSQPYTAFGISQDLGGNSNAWWLFNYKTLSGDLNNYININYLMNFLNRKILSKLKDTVNNPQIFSDADSDCYSNKYFYLKSANPNNILLLSKNTIYDATDGYGFILDSKTNRVIDAKRWLPSYKTKRVDAPTFYNDTSNPAIPKNRKEFGQSGNIFINLELINSITKRLSKNTDQFTVGNFLKEIGNEINSATGGAITMKLITDPEDLTVMYYRDVNWIKDDSSPKPYLLPMFASDPRGSVVREFKLSAKLPSSVQSLMYSINSTDKVTESQLGPYISFMYNNGTSTRTPQTITTNDGKQVTVDELTTYGGSKELTEKLAQQYVENYDKYSNEIQNAADAYGNDPKSETKRVALQSALTKYLQYPFPTIQQTNQVAAPTFPIEAEFTIDGINGLRYGDIIDFPGLPEKYRKNSTFTIKGINHTISTTGEWTTQVSCLMRPKFD